MKNLAFCAASLTFALLHFAPPVAAKPAQKGKKQAPQIQWQPSYWAARKAARRSGKPLFIDFYTDWCGPCKILDQTTYRDAKFIAYSRGWIMVKVNPEKSALGRKLADKYKIPGFPTMILTDGSGAKYGEASGALPTPKLLPKMKKAAYRAQGLRA